MSNFFAALDSDDEGPPKVAPKKKEVPKAPIAEPSRQTDRRTGSRQPGNDRNTKGGRGQKSQPVRDGKRQFDRRSGTGRGKEGKKDGAGARNWGSDKNDARRAEGAVQEGAEASVLEGGEKAPKADEEVAGGDAETAEVEAPKEEKKVEEEPVEVEEVTISYEEYLLTKKNPDSVAFKSLQVKELESNDFADKQSKVYKEEEFLNMGGTKQPRKKGGKKGEKPTVAVGFRHARPESDEGRGGDRREGGGDRREGGGDRRDGRGGGRGRGRGGRVGGRGGGGRGRGGDRPRKTDELNVTDDSAFPSL